MDSLALTFLSKAIIEEGRELGLENQDLQNSDNPERDSGSI